MPYDCVLKPGEVARIPLGFGLIIPDGFAGYVFPRSSMAAKGLVCELPPIDSGYRGEIHAIISNVKFSYYCIGSNYTDFDTDLEAEANINEEGNEDCSAIL